MKNYYFLWLLALTTHSINAQKIKGSICSEAQRAPLSGAVIHLFNSDSGEKVLTLVTDEKGRFASGILKPGRYAAEIIHPGYRTARLPELLLAKRTQLMLPLSLQSGNETMGATTLPAAEPLHLRPIGEVPLTREAAERLPAIWHDPARLAATQPGVYQVDDATNRLSIRGNSPATLRYRLAGLDLINPHHLQFMRKQQQQAAALGGGFSLFSTAILDHTTLLTGTLPAGYGDALGGVMDLRLRAGDKFYHRISAQASAFGANLSAEGPLHGQERISYLLHYRNAPAQPFNLSGYSADNEQLQFQDLAFHLHAIGKKGSTYSIFGIQGNSRIETDLNDTLTREDHTGNRIFGATANLYLGRKVQFNAAVVYAENEQKARIPAGRDLNFPHWETYRDTRLGLHATLQFAFRQSTLSFGAQKNNIDFFFSDIRSTDVINYYLEIRRSTDYYNFLPFMRWDWKSFDGKWQLQTGIQFHYNEAYHNWASGPRAMLAYRFLKQHQLAIQAGLHHQEAPAWTQIEQLTLNYQTATHVGLKYVYTPARDWRLQAEWFLQKTNKIPTLRIWGYLLHNEPEVLRFALLWPNGQALSHGMELQLEKSMQKGWSLNVNTTLFRNQSRAQAESPWLDARWDVRHLFNLCIGKEWAFAASRLGLSGRLNWTGGKREAAVDLGLSDRFDRTILNLMSGYYLDFPDYWRIDAKLYWSHLLGKKCQGTLALDVQNLSNLTNLAYHYYDTQQRDVVAAFQAGILPNLSWRIGF